MKRLITLLYYSLGIVALRADLVMSLSADIQNGARGTELVFRGTLTNTSASQKLYLNDIVSTLNGPSATHLSFESNSFFFNVPGILLPNESYTDSELFRVLLNGSAPAGDYTGSITVQGGTDIQANAVLASASFTILSPDVTIVATDPNASEFGLDPGVFTIARTGGTGIELPVFFAISGNAVNGTSYNAIVPMVSIPPGSSSATVTITPIPDNVAEGDRSAILSLTSASTYNLGLAVIDTVTIHDKPFDVWRLEKFGANANDPAAADGGDWDGDSIQNLLEYALDLDPTVANVSALPVAINDAGYLTISFLPNNSAIDVTLVVEGSDDLTNWNTSKAEVVPVQNPNPPSLQTYRYKTPIGQANVGYLRLRGQRLGP